MFLSLSFIIIFGLLCFFFLLMFSRVFHTEHHKKLIVYTPPSYPIIGCLLSFYKNRYCLLDWYTKLLASSPTKTIVVHRLGAPRTVVTASAENVEYMLKNNFLNFPKGEPMNQILGDFLGRGIFNVDGDLWSAQRKLASHEFTARSLRELVMKTLEEEVDGRLSPLLEAAARNSSVLDLQDVLRRFAFDTICKISLGSDPGCLSSSDSSAESLVDAFDKASEISARRGMAPVFAVWKCKRAFNVGSEKKLREHIKVVHDHVEEIIRVRKQEKANNIAAGAGSDFLSRLLDAGHKDEVVRDMVISFLVAGRDTTSSALTWFFWLLSKHPNIETTVIKQVLSSDDQKTLNFDHLREMNYIKACLCESMRLYPPVAWDSKHAANDDVLPDGTPIYRGNRVTFSPYAMGRMENLWGNDWLEFKPDRWFDEQGKLKMISPFKFPVFQAGPRVCLGKEMAFIQMKFVVASILRRFEIRPVCESQPVFVPLLTGYMAKGLYVRVHMREGYNNN
ncbi:PREDICTED: cytochrome P450 94B3-like [Ipomoea nil]|uniref:cytochrome P450 94B3-like n=1 Tax=Ipomoea nil TaxID=35883 RepID=UPI000901458D|nr:PREDICTED: cytochrome P450 94B3-like [Ipomoea nil]